jgi:hypothetical protein
MHQATASLHREIATIDTKGLRQISGQSYHYIYLYVETHNMPYRVDTGYAPPTYVTAMNGYTQMNKVCAVQQCGGCVNDGVCLAGTSANACGINGNACISCSDGGVCQTDGTCGYPIPIIGSPVRKSVAAATPAARVGYDCKGFDPKVPAPSEDWFTKNMPTVIVHAYGDTGVTQKINGKVVPVLTPMTSFGQWVTHDASTEGNAFGWDANLEPAGNTAFQKVGPNTYRIRIPNEGSGQVVTHVEPLPTKRPTCSGAVDLDIVTLLKAIAPLITISSENAGEINALIDSLAIECEDLQELLTKIDNGHWGGWQSWIHYLVTQVEATDGCHCK